MEDNQSNRLDDDKQSDPIIKSRRRKRRCLIPVEEVGVSYEEEKMLSLAIKNSIREQKASCTRDFSIIKEMKVFEPSEIEFADPIRYLENLYKQGVWKYGCIKIIPPSTFEPPFAFNENSSSPLPTRFQTLQDLSQGKVSLLVIFYE